MQVGIVIPTLNSARTLEWTLLSLFRQEGCDVRVVVADSSSTDGTLDLCERWRLRVIQVPPGNMYRAINVGLRALDTEWFGYLNSDDVLYLDGLRRLTTAAADAHADIAYGTCDYIDSAGRFTYAITPAPPGHLRALFLRGIFPFAQPATIVRRQIADRLGGFSEHFHHAADYDFFARAEMNGAKFVCVPTPSIAAFRVHPAQLSATGARDVAEEVADIRRALPGESLPSNITTEVLWRIRNLDQTAIAFLRNRSIRRHARGGRITP